MRIIKEPLKYLSFFAVSFFTLTTELAKASDICVPYFSATRQLERVWMGGNALKMPKIPPQFSAGCTYVDTGASNLKVFVLSGGAIIEGEYNPLRGTGIPRLQSTVTSSLLNDERVLELFTICTSNGTYKYCLDKPKNRAYQDYFAGKLVTCFSGLCLRSSSLSSNEQLDIMNSLSSRK